MQDYEKLGVFYLGRQYDLERRARQRDLVLYDSRHLVTHGLVVGMTGSGKTGLCIALIEEAALDGIPALVIDPKGDLGNLLLTFPELAPADFAPWINPEDARRKGLSEADYAAQQAETWRRGLAEWDQDGDRIRRLRAAAEFAIYTPGGSAGRPVSILSSFGAPPPDVVEDAELLQDRITSTVAGLLGLIGVNAEATRSREAMLLAQLFLRAWTEGRDLDLPALIQQVQTPPVQRVGVMEIESFFPAKERFELAMQLNQLLASPAFATWLQGEPLEVSRLLFTETGKPRIAILSIAHLGEAERMFFVTLLLNQVLGWMRTQSGTNSLRALVYMDEIAGYFPPVANPPSKRPFLTLLKQARAFGVGVTLATQNPVDLDYKGLANIGTWFLGRLQTERDKERVLEGLEGAAVGQGGGLDRAAAARMLSALGNRVFLLHDVHEERPIVFESRWAMSYLRGPLSREQIKRLIGPQPTGSSSGTSAPVASAPEVNVPGVPGLTSGGVAASRAARSTPPGTARPVLPPDVRECFAPVRRGAVAPGTTLVYQPRLLGAASVRFTNPRLSLDLGREVLVTTGFTDGLVPVDWADATEADFSLDDLASVPPPAEFAPLPPAASRAANFAAWAKDFSRWLGAEQKLTLLRSAALNETSRPDEDERAFRIRLQQVARERRDAEAERLRQVYAPRLAAFEERLRRARAAREREASQAARARLDTIVSLGSTLLGAFLGRKAISASTMSRAATTVRRAGRAVDQSGDVGRAEETIEALEQQRQELEAQFQSETEAVLAGAAALGELETIEVPAARGGVQVRLVALAWVPFQRDASGALAPAF